MNVKSGSFETRFTYTDQEKDAESGLLYYGARYYHPVLGRFMQADPVVVDTGRREFKLALLNPQTLNPYSYVANNPLKLVDPTGESGNQFGVPFDYTSEGARVMGQFFQNTAENWRAQVNPLSVNTGATAYGITSYTVAEGLDMVGGMFQNAQKVFDPETPSSQKAVAGIMLSLDLAGGGKGGTLTKITKEAENIAEITNTVGKTGYKMTDHATLRAIERNINGQAIVNTIQNGAKTLYREGKDLMIGYHNSKTGEFVARIANTDRIRTVIKNTTEGYVKNLKNSLYAIIKK